MAAGALAKYAAAGGIGACVSHAGAVPLDVIKTRVQLEPEKFAGGGVLDNARTLVAEEGKSVLLRGLGSTMAGFAVHGARSSTEGSRVSNTQYSTRTVPSPPSPSTIDSPPSSSPPHSPRRWRP